MADEHPWNFYLQTAIWFCLSSIYWLRLWHEHLIIEDLDSCFLFWYYKRGNFSSQHNNDQDKIVSTKPQSTSYLPSPHCFEKNNYLLPNIKSILQLFCSSGLLEILYFKNYEYKYDFPFAKWILLIILNLIEIFVVMVKDQSIGTFNNRQRHISSGKFFYLFVRAFGCAFVRLFLHVHAYYFVDQQILAISSISISPLEHLAHSFCDICCYSLFTENLVKFSPISFHYVICEFSLLFDMPTRSSISGSFVFSSWTSLNW